MLKFENESNYILSTQFHEISSLLNQAFKIRDNKFDIHHIKITYPRNSELQGILE